MKVAELAMLIAADTGPYIPSNLAESGPHSDRIRDEAELLIARAVPETDPFLYNLLQRHFDEMENLPGLDDRETLIQLISRFVNRSDGQATAREATIHLARSGWDIDSALQNYLDASVNVSEDEGSESALDSGDDSVPGEGLQTQGPSNAADSTADNEATRAKTAAMNLHIDREPALKGRKDLTKLVIKINLPEGGEKTSKYPAYNEGDHLDWDNPVHIRDLNRWRSQNLRRDLGPVRPPFIPYLPVELDFLTQQYTDHLRTHQAQHPDLPLDWHELDWNAITKEFNRRFADTVPQQGGPPRPERSQNSLLTQRYRVKAICDLTGKPLKTDMTVKGKWKRGGGKRGG